MGTLHRELTCFAVDGLPTVGIRLLMGVVILLVMMARGKEKWLTKAGERACEVPESME
jgi:hypothetical protein